MLKLLVPFGIKLKTKLSKCNSILARKIGEAIPILNYKGVYSLSYKQLLDWAILDTFDMFSPKYDQPQDIEDVREWFKKQTYQKVRLNLAATELLGEELKLRREKL